MAQGLACSKCSIKGAVVACAVTARGGRGFSMESEDRACPHWGGGSSRSLGWHPGGAKSRVCSFLIAAQVGRLAELGAASGRATGPG